MLVRIANILLGIAVLMFLFVSCADEQTRMTDDKYYAIGQTINLDGKEEPRWTLSEGGIIQHEDEKYAWIKGEGTSRNKAIAKQTAISDAQGRMTQSLKVVVASQFAQAWEAIGEEGEREQIEQIKQGLIAAKAKANIIGFKLIKSYHTQVGKIQSLSSSGKPQSFRAVSFKYIAMMGMPYPLYIKLREDIINGVDKIVPLNSRQKKLINKVESELKKLDDDPKELFVEKE